MKPVAHVPLGTVATLQSGVGFPLELQGRKSGDYPLAKVGDISRVGRSGESTLSTADHYVDENDLVRLRAKPIPAGSILFSKIGEAIRQNHRVIAGRPLLLDNNAMAAIPHPAIESRFLYHCLRTIDFYALASATTVPSLRKSELDRLSIPLPPLEEQQRIAAILDKADALRRKRKRALELLDTLSQSIFLEMFGDPVRSDGDAALLALGDVVCDIESGWSPTCLDRAAVDDEPGVLKLSAITAVKFAAAENKALPATLAPKPGTEVAAGDILFCRKNTRDLVGSSVYVWETRPRLHMSDLIFRIVPMVDKIEPIFLHAQIALPSQRRKISEMSGGAAGSMPNVSKSRLRELKIAVPSLSAQRDFANAVKAQRTVEVRSLQATTHADHLFASLQNRAFSGQL